jgi:hypothetical protein
MSQRLQDHPTVKRYQERMAVRAGLILREPLEANWLRVFAMGPVEAPDPEQGSAQADACLRSVPRHLDAFGVIAAAPLEAVQRNSSTSWAGCNFLALSPFCDILVWSFAKEV